MLLHQSYTKLTQSLLDTPISGLKYSFYSNVKKDHAVIYETHVTAFHA